MENEEIYQTNDIEENYEIKVILLGESGVGKSNLINVAVGKPFSSKLDSTVSSTFVLKKCIRGNISYNLNIWDTAGQEKFRALTKLFIKNSKIVIFVYAIDSKPSFEALQFWGSTIKESLGDEPVLAIVGNKLDLYLHEQIKEIDVENYAKEIGAQYILVSAKTNPQAFINFLEQLLDEYLKKSGTIIRESSFELKKEKYEKKSKKKCC